MTPGPTPPIIVPDVITASSLSAAFPALSIVTIASYELQVSRAGSPIILRVKLPHADVQAEAFATWPGVTQRFACAGGVGRATETNKWEEPAEWTVAWHEWVAGWLQALAATDPRPVRPGEPTRAKAPAVRNK